jgi:hypothetical protein
MYMQLSTPLGLSDLPMFCGILNRRLSASKPFDKIVFLFLVSVACCIHIRLTVAFVENLLLPYCVSGYISLAFTTALLYLGMVFSLGLCIWHDVFVWAQTNGNEKKW